jgi:hypothetical protein
VPTDADDQQPLKKQDTAKMTNKFATGFLKMLKSNNNIDDRTMALIARASIAKKHVKPKAATTPVVYEQNMLDDIDKIEELDKDETNEKGSQDNERAANPLMAGLLNNKIQSEDDSQSDPAKRLADMLRPKLGSGAGWANLHKKVAKKKLYEEDQQQV